MLLKELIHRFSNVMLRGQTLARRFKISGSGVESCFCTPYLQQRRIQNLLKRLRCSGFAYPVNDFKLLTVYAKTLPLRCLRGF